MPSDAVTVNQPRHKLSELTTSELAAYRRQLESAVAFFDRKTPVPPVRAELQARLDAVLAEKDDRARLARA